MMTRGVFLAFMTAGLLAGGAALAANSEGYIGPNDGPGGTPAWTPQPPDPPSPPKPRSNVELYPGYNRAVAVSECMESVMPLNGLSPVDIAASSVAYTPDKAAAIASCVQARGFQPDPVAFANASADDINRALDDVTNNYTQERQARSQATRESIAKMGLTGFVSPEGSRPAASAQVSMVRSAMAAPPPVTAVPAVQAPPQPATKPPLSVPAAVQPASSPRGQGVFVPSSGSSMASPVFLH